MENVRLIHSVDKLKHLRTLVKQDLKQFGIKVQKSKRTKKLNQSRNSSQDGMLATGIFGNYLSFIPSTFIPDCGFVPKFLVDAAEIIRKNSMVEGIFRKSGSINRQKELKQQIEEGQKLQSENMHDVTGLIKQFFRELPEPLLTITYHDCFVRTYYLPPPDQVEALLLLCLLLPPEHLSTLRFTMGLLSHLSEHYEHNKMDCSNLAVVLAPNIIHVNSRSQKMNATEEKLLQVHTSIVELLIAHAQRIGVVSESLYERTCLMTECFGTEDELDGSDDKTLEDAKEARKKRRKRSGSLQGLVSSIGRGLSKLRRSTEGKNNLTTSSTSSSLSSTSSGLPGEPGLTSQLLSQSHTLPKPAAKESVPTGILSVVTLSATPVLRKRKASTDGIPFSSNKKKAILEQLPYRSALGATPFTPASARRPEQERAMQAGGDTPRFALPDKHPHDFSTTPNNDNRTVRKRLGLLSPASSKKTKRNNTHLCSNPLHRSGKAKYLLKRLSGTKDKDFVGPEKKRKIGKCLESPASALGNMAASEITSSISLAENLHLVSSPTLHDASTSSSITVHNTLNQGFIAHDDEVGGKDKYHTVLASSESTSSVHSGSVETCSSVTTIDSLDSQESAGVQWPGLTDGLLRRGQPNTITNGLLRGKPENLSKLRRSFDRSDINCLIPATVPSVSEMVDVQRVSHTTEAQATKECEAEDELQAKHGEGVKTFTHVGLERVPDDGSLALFDPQQNGFTDQTVVNADEDRFGSYNGSLALSEPQQCSFADRTMMNMAEDRFDCGDGIVSQNLLAAADNSSDSDTESEAGFSTISGGTVIHNPKGLALSCTNLQSDDEVSVLSLACCSSSMSVNNAPPLLQPSTSVDSLISSASETSVSSHVRLRIMERTISSDSGKGSMLESATAFPDDQFSLQENLSKVDSKEEIGTSKMLIDKEVSKSADTSIPRKATKCVSDDRLHTKSRVDCPPTRSHSLHTVGSERHFNFIPNLQISAETHRLLTRAGFLQDVEVPHHFKDVSVPLRSPQKSGGIAFHKDIYRASCRSMDMVAVNRNNHSCRRQTCEKKTEKSQADSVTLKTSKTESLDKNHCKEGKELVLGQGYNHSEHNGRPKTSILKHAEFHLQKHDSIARIKETKAGHVAANIQVINSIDCSSLDKPVRSQHLFTSFTRRRGMSPISIPTIFAKDNEKEIHYCELAQKVSKRSQEEETLMTRVIPSNDKNLSKKLVLHQGIGVDDVQSSETWSEELQQTSFTADCAANFKSSNNENCASAEVTKVIKKSELIFSPLGKLNTDLSASLMESIEEVITPCRRRRQYHNLGDRPPLNEKTNQSTPIGMPETKWPPAKGARKLEPSFSSLDKLFMERDCCVTESIHRDPLQLT